MSTAKCKWSEAQKLQIQEAEQNGVTETMRKYNLAHSLYRKWRKAYNGEGYMAVWQTEHRNTSGSAMKNNS